MPTSLPSLLLLSATAALAASQQPSAEQLAQARLAASSTNALIQDTPVGSESYGSAPLIKDLIIVLKSDDPFYTVIGMVASLFGGFDSSTEKILEQLQFIEN